MSDLENPSSSFAEFKKFLKPLINWKGSSKKDKRVCTHTNMGSGRRSYNISDKEASTFFKLYANSLDGGADLHFTEIQRDRAYTPIKIDLDFRYQSDKVERRYTKEMIEQFVSSYIKHICEWVDFDSDPRQYKAMRCFVMEKSSARENEKKSIHKSEKAENGKGKEIKDGIHIIFPYIVTEPLIQYKLRDAMLKEMGPIFEPMNLTNPNSDVLDRAVIEQNGWLLVGSKKPNGEPYEISEIYEFKRQEMTGGAGQAPVMEHTTCASTAVRGARKASMAMGAVEADASGEVVIDLDNPLPEPENEFVPFSVKDTVNLGSTQDVVELLSVRNKSHQMSPILLSRQEELSELRNSLEKKRQDKALKKIIKSKNQMNETEMDFIREFTKCLSVERASNRNTWMEVGWCLHNIGYGQESDFYLDWVEFSKKDPHYFDYEQDLQDEWDQMERSNFTQGSLRHWAKVDNPKQYNSIIGKEVQSKIIKSIEPKIEIGVDDIDKVFKGDKVTEEDVARVVHAMFKHEFICIGTKAKGTYFHFKNHRYQELDGNIVLRNKISTDVYQAYHKLVIETLKENAGSADLYQDNKAKLKKYLKTLDSLRSTKFKENVMTECIGLFYKPEGESKEFINRLDETYNLLGCENGVYDLDSLQFRNGNPDDMIRFSTQNDYVEYSWDHPIVEEIQDFLESVFIEKDELEYVMMVLASFLHGNNFSESFHIFTGTGANGKSKLLELYEMAIGDYAGKLPISLLTTKRADSGSANPELRRTKGLRCAVLQEPDENTRMNVGLMKELTGGDKIQVRGLYEMPIEFKPQFKMILTCNHLPKLPEDDYGTWRRVKSVEFKSQFLTEAEIDEDNPHHFLRDETLSKKFPEWKEAFLWMLVEHFKLFKKNNYRIPEPDSVTAFTKKYHEKQEHFRDFCQEHLKSIVKPTEEPGAILSMKDIYREYKNWHMEQGIDHKPKQSKDLKKYIESCQYLTYIDEMDGSQKHMFKQKEKPFGSHKGEDGKRHQGWLGLTLETMDEDIVSIPGGDSIEPSLDED